MSTLIRKPTTVPMDLSAAEVKLILRLRQLRKISGPTNMMILTIQPLAISCLGQWEALDIPATIYASGSAIAQ